MAETDMLWLLGVIAAHDDSKVVGRTRLQKTVKLLQRVGLPTKYSYDEHFYGPYSEGLQTDVDLLCSAELVHEEPKQTHDGSPYYVISTDPKYKKRISEESAELVQVLAQEDAVTLELAATYDFFLQTDPDSALPRLKKKKGPKASPENIDLAEALLRKLELYPS